MRLLLPRTAASRLRSCLRSWFRQERRGLPSAAVLRTALLTSLLLLSPLLAFELLRRVSGVRQAQQQKRVQVLEVLDAAQGALRRTTRDWAHWDDTYAFLLGRNPDYMNRHIAKTPIFEDGSVMQFFDPDGRLLQSHGQPGDRAHRDPSLQRCAASNLPRLTEPASPQAIMAMVPLLCRSSDGRHYLGMASPISDSQALRPAHGTLVLLSPLLRREYGPHLKAGLRSLEADVVVVPVSASRQPPAPSLIETVTGQRLRSNGGGVVALRPQGIWLEIGRSLAEQSLLLLSLLLLLLIVRALLMLERRRQQLAQRRQELRASRLIRRIGQELDSLLQQMGVDTAQAAPDARVLARLIGRDVAGSALGTAPFGFSSAGTAAPGTGPAGREAGEEAPQNRRVAERLRRLTERFQYFLASTRRLALCDSLTQLPNRRYFLEYLALEADRQRQQQGRFAVLFVDIDKFKSINDTYGHAVGDQALLAVAERLRELMRSGDFLARYGGDEFVVLMPLRPEAVADDYDLRADVYGFANRIASRFDEVLRLETAALEINLSIGVALVNPAEINPQEAVKRSDEAMYRAKLHKTSRIAIFSIDDVVQPQDNYQIYLDLIQAARARDLSIRLQPIVDGKGGAWAVEALARWIHPIHGEITPDHFLDLAERYRQMILLGEALLDRSLEAFRQLDGLRDPEGLPLRLNLNLSPSQLCDPSLVTMFSTALERHGLTAARLTLELTETAVLDQSSTVRDNLARLRQQGMRLAIDDFGTGYSSLQLLQTLRPDQVKIDQTFIQGMTHDPYARRIVGLLAGMAPLMGVEIVAEGVENRAAFDILRGLGVNRFQGYLFSPPLAAERLCAQRGPLPASPPPSPGAESLQP